MSRSIYLLASVSLLGACATVDRIIPAAELANPAVTAKAPASWSEQIKSDPAAASASWVRSFEDQKLQALVAEALMNNHTLGSTLARLEQADALARAGNAARLPSVTLGSSGTGNAIPNASDTDSYGANLSTSWQIDLWGRIRDRAQAGYKDAEAAHRDMDALTLSISGQTARAWFDLVSANQQVKLAKDDVKTRERSLGIVQRRYKRGLSSSLEVRLGRSALAGSQASLAFQQQQFGNAGRRLEILLGRYPADAIKAASSFPALGVMSPVGVPSDLLVRRPDIRASENRLQAAGLRVSDARKALLPSLSISGSASTGGGSLGDIVDFDQAIGQLVGSLSQPLFRGGAIRADIERSEAAYRVQLENYAQTVLVAWREVEDALAAEKWLAERETALRISAGEAGKAEKLAEREYGRGVGTIFELLDAQRRRISAEGQLITASAARASNRVNLYLALGGNEQPEAVETAQTGSEETRA